MKKKLLLPALLLLVILLSGCAPKNEADVDLPTLGSSPQPNPLAIEQSATEPDTPISSVDLGISLPDNIDPTAEEDDDDEREYIGITTQTQQQAQTQIQALPVDNSTPSPYAGSSPIPLNPIDMPTPTPRADLVFTYDTYVAAGLGLTFESVAGYEVDESDVTTYILREPENLWKDNKGVVITLSQTTVTSSYTKSDINKDLKTRLNDMGQMNYRRWEPSNTAERALMRAPGYYANYRGELMDGTIIRGRIHMALLPGNKVLMLQIEHPAEYNDDYIKVHSHIRSTLKAI